VNQESDARQSCEKLDDSDIRVQDHAALQSVSEHGSAVESLPPIEPVNTTENGGGDIALLERDEVPGCDTQPCADNGDAKQSTFNL